MLFSISIIYYDKDSEVEESHTGFCFSPNRSWADEGGVWDAIFNCGCLYFPSPPIGALLMSENGWGLNNKAEHLIV